MIKQHIFFDVRIIKGMNNDTLKEKKHIKWALWELCSHFLFYYTILLLPFGVTDAWMSIFHLIPWSWLHPRSKSCDGPDWKSVGDFISHGALPVHKLNGITLWKEEQGGRKVIQIKVKTRMRKNKNKSEESTRSWWQDGTVRCWNTWLLS